MKVTVYSKPLCPHCVHLKDSLTRFGIEYDELMVGRDLEVLDLLSRFPDAKVVPILAIGGHQIGGVEELLDLIKNDQLKFLES